MMYDLTRDLGFFPLISRGCPLFSLVTINNHVRVSRLHDVKSFRGRQPYPGSAVDRQEQRRDLRIRRARRDQRELQHPHRGPEPPGVGCAEPGGVHERE